MSGVIAIAEMLKVNTSLQTIKCAAIPVNGHGPSAIKPSLRQGPLMAWTIHKHQGPTVDGLIKQHT
eukprot:3622238-Prymnesium_polylepis.1